MENEKVFLSFDIGGTSIKYAIVDDKMNILLHKSIDTNSNKDDFILKSLKRITTDLKRTYNVKGVGISTAGIVDSKNGSIKYANYLIPGYIGTPLKKDLEDLCGIPVYVVNDVQAALLGEILQDILEDKTFCLTLGTGIGGAFFVKDEIYHGAHDYENYIGHMNYDSKTKTTWEQRCSTIALQKRLKELSGISVPEAFELARNNDETSKKIIENWIEEIAKGIANIILLLDPSTILIGGGVSKQNDYLLPILKRKLKNYLPESFLKAQLKTPSSCNENALLGALYPFFKGIERMR